MLQSVQCIETFVVSLLGCRFGRRHGTRRDHQCHHVELHIHWQLSCHVKGHRCGSGCRGSASLIAAALVSAPAWADTVSKQFQSDIGFEHVQAEPAEHCTAPALATPGSSQLRAATLQTAPPETTAAPSLLKGALRNAMAPCMQHRVCWA